MTGAWRRGTLRAGPRAAAAEIVKVGGSLLALRDWPERLAELVAASPAPLLVVGGGRVVDGLREIDAANPRPTPLMHDLAIDAMTLTARIVADALGLPVVALATDGGVLDAAAWLRSSGQAARLPAGWHVTSDSIAALVAAETGRGLLLAKRVPPPAGDHDLERLATAGWVDAHFPGAAAAVATITWAAPA
ncbi:MAG: hypothetical protein EBX35_06420 [Planctomycetia bacterium]|nr:hypothetical protein [Planctomycetia bacterium]